MYTAVDEARLNSQAAACEALANKIMEKEDTEAAAAVNVNGSWTGEAATLWANKVKMCDEAAIQAAHALSDTASELRAYTDSHHYIIEKLEEEARKAAAQTETSGGETAFGSGGSMGGR